MNFKRFVPLGLGLLVLTAGCHQDMWLQAKAKPQSKSDGIFADKSNSRLPVMGTVAYNKARENHEFFTGFDKNGRLLKEFPVVVNEELIKRGQDRFRIFCTPCHGELGNGQGFVAKRGFTMARPVGNYHSDRLRNMPVGHFFDVITNGFGTMYPFRSRIKPYDRWAIAAYIRVLQESQHQPLSAIPSDEQAKLNNLPEDPSQDAPKELPINEPSPVAQPGTQIDAVPTTRGAREVPIGRRPITGVPQTTPDATEKTPDGAGTTQPGGNR